MNTIGQRLVEKLPLHGECIPVQPENMLSINFAYRLFESFVKRWQPPVLWIAGLVNRVVSRYPRIPFVAGCDLFPEPDRAVLVVLVVPKGGVVCRVVAVPVACVDMSLVLDLVPVFLLSRLTVLTTRDCMHVDDGVDVMLSTLSPSQVSNSLALSRSALNHIHTSSYPLTTSTTRTHQLNNSI